MSETTVWVLDWYGYDARGGHARVFSNLERAKAAAGPGADQWVEDGDGWFYDPKAMHDLSDLQVIYPVVVDPKETL